MTSIDIMKIILKLEKLNRDLNKEIEKAEEDYSYFFKKAKEEGNYKITDTMTVNEFLEELDKLIKNYEKQIEENNYLIKKLEKEQEGML